MTSDVTRRLAHYAVRSRYDDVPRFVRDEAVRSVVNWVGCAIGGSTHEAVERTLAALSDYKALPQAGVLGRRERLDALHAALVNGLSSHVYDFDDTHLKTLLHASVAVLPALLAISEARRVSGIELLHAFIVGVEIESRIANAIYANHNSDWYITGTCGPMGGAAAAGVLLHLHEQQMTHAIAVATTLGAGLRQMAGTMAKPLVHGRAAQNGLYAARLAQSGFTASEEAIEGPRGFARVLDASDVDSIVRGLGETYEIADNTYKPYACGVVAHPVIDACIRLRGAHTLPIDEIACVELRVHPQALKLTGIRAPRSALESKWSVYHAAAVALVRGAAGEHEFGDEAVHDDRVRAVRARVQAREDATLAQDEAYVTIERLRGESFECHVEHAVGSVANPMTNDDLSAKFRGLARDILTPRDIDRLLDLCWSIETLDDASQIVSASVPRSDRTD